MKKYKWTIILLNLAIVLIYFNHSITKKEALLKEGQLILLELAPVDPRSLMQGDYMELRYNISEDINFNNGVNDNPKNSLPKRGYCVVKIDANGVASKIRFQQALTPLNKDEHLIKYTSPNRWNINIGAESFFFQEGHAEKYEEAKYGGVKIDAQGNSLLIGLYDKNRIRIE